MKCNFPIMCPLAWSRRKVPSFCLVFCTSRSVLYFEWIFHFSFETKRKRSKGTEVPSHLFPHVVSALQNVSCGHSVLCSCECAAALGASQSIKSYPRAWHQEHWPALYRNIKLEWARHFSSATFLKLAISFWKRYGSETSPSKQMSAVNNTFKGIFFSMYYEK